MANLTAESCYEEVIRISRLSKKRKEEWAIFLDKRNRITYNKLCLRCRRDCKQSFRVKVIDCHKFERKE